MTTKRIKPGTGQESVWDYPRPPKLEWTTVSLRVVAMGATIAQTRRGCRVLETSHPPVYYFPPEDVSSRLLIPAPGISVCEFKGEARYWTICVDGKYLVKAAWSFPEPTSRYKAIADYIAFYASRVDSCWVGEERAQAQQGDFYGGWVTSGIVGPFKVGPDTSRWEYGGR